MAQHIHLLKTDLGHLRTWELFFGAAENDLWNTVWNLGGPPKLIHFIWRACKGSLAVMDVLYKRHISTTRACPICGSAEETIMHSLFECKHALQIWNHSAYSDLILAAPSSSFPERMLWINGKMDKNQLRTVASLLWAAWFCRNKSIFESSIAFEPIKIASGFVKLNEDYALYNGKVRLDGSISHVRLATSWSPPPQSCVKINVDVHVSNGNGVSFGVVIRDEVGRPVIAAVKRLNVNWPPALAEAGAARYGVEVARRFDFQNVILECDALQVVRSVDKMIAGAAPICAFHNQELLSST